MEGKMKKKQLRFDLSARCQKCQSSIAADEEAEGPAVANESKPSTSSVDSFIVLHARGSKTSSSVGKKVKTVRRARVNRRELLSLALGCSIEDGEDPEQIMLLPRLGQVGTGKTKFDKKCLCAECLSYVQGYLRREFLEQCQVQYQIRELDKRVSSQVGQGVEREFEKEVEVLLRKQGDLVAEMSKIEREMEQLQQSAVALEEEEAELDQLEHMFWTDFNRTVSMASQVGESRDSLLCKISRRKDALEQLGPVHAFNDAFFIWRDGEYGTINGFRLGQLLGLSRVLRKASPLPELRQPPEWEEINTAWGLSAMLLLAIAHSCRFEFTGYRIEPMGSRTTMLRLGSSRTALDYLTPGKNAGRYNLFFDSSKANNMLDRIGGFITARNPSVDSFCKAMRAFLVCLYQISEVAMQSPSGESLKLRENMYTIDIPAEQNWHKELPPNSATINGDSVDLKHSPMVVVSSAQEDGTLTNRSSRSLSVAPSEEDVENSYRWTIALRHILTNLKWLLVWSVKEKKAKQVL